MKDFILIVIGFAGGFAAATFGKTELKVALADAKAELEALKKLL